MPVDAGEFLDVADCMVSGSGWQSLTEENRTRQGLSRAYYSGFNLLMAALRLRMGARYNINHAPLIDWLIEAQGPLKVIGILLKEAKGFRIKSDYHLHQLVSNLDATRITVEIRNDIVSQAAAINALVMTATLEPPKDGAGFPPKHRRNRRGP